MPHVNILKKIRTGDEWKLVSIPRDRKDRYNWQALPEGRYFIEWYSAGRRKRQSAGVTAAQALEAQRRKEHELEGEVLGITSQSLSREIQKTPLHIALKRYLELVQGLKKPNTYRKYKAVLNRFVDYFAGRVTTKSVTPDDLNRYTVYLKDELEMNSNTVVHNMIVIAQFLKRQGRPGLTREIDLPQKIAKLPQEYNDDQLNAFFKACTDRERALFMTFLLTGFREKEVVYLSWSDINFKLKTLRVTAKPELGFYPKRWEEREVPVPGQLTEQLQSLDRKPGASFVFPSPTGNRELHMLDKCKAVAERAGLNPESFDLRKFRSTYATRMLRAGFDVRTVQVWMGHKSLETTMRYLAPARDVREKLEQVRIGHLLGRELERSSNIR